MGQRVLLFVNRSARRGEEAFAEAVERLTALGFEVIDACRHPDDRAADRIRELAAEVDLIVIGGGDGTLNAAADALVEVNKPFGILPLGTANDLALTLNIPTDLETACGVIAAGHRRRIDLGRVNGKHFFNAASVGLSVGVTRRLSKEQKGRLGVFAYLVAAVGAVWAGRPFRAELTVDGQTHRVKTVQLTVGNGRHYGGGLTIAADAAIDDDRLDVYSLEVRGWWQLVPLLWRLRAGTLAGSPMVRTLSGRVVEVVTRKPRRVSTDGEITTRTPARFEVLPGVVEVFAPPRSDSPAPAAAAQPERPLQFRRLLGWVGRNDLLTLGGALVVVCGLLAFFLVAGAARGGGPDFDEQLLRSLRRPDAPNEPVGPRWLKAAMLDVTALGGYTVLSLLTGGVAGYLLLRRRWGVAGLVVAATVGGMLATDALKGLYDRPRPAVVPHLAEVTNASFPSGHSAMAAVVYLTLGELLARWLARRWLRAYLLGWAMGLTVLVGVSRVFLGVHYPTDVLAGWAVGLSWAVLCGLVARALHLRRERRQNSVAAVPATDAGHR
jgi:YegS/Rv2252/BmrU family lipid kinase